MRVLITGGAGFIGGHLAKRILAEGIPVDLVDNFSRAVHDPFLDAIKQSKGVGLIERDLLQPDALDSLDDSYTHIVHLAAIVGVKHVLERPYQVLRDNETMTFHAMDLAKRQKNLERFVFASTSEVVAGTLKHFGITIPTPETTPLTIGDPGDVRTTYMLSKIYGEALCHHSGLPFTIVRPHNFYGPRMGLVHVIPQLAERAFKAQDGDELEVYSPTHQRTFCYIDDAVEMIWRLMSRSEGEKGTFNIGAESPELTMRQVAEKVVKVVGRDLTVTDGPVMHSSPERRAPDMSHTRKAADYDPQISLDEGVTRTVDWYRANVFENAGQSAV
ncbi:MAG: NAD-dependent epimerase/dehydratase family protein [Phycisphaeraceae bacterium]